MPLLRHALYSQNVNLYLAPTADARDTWLPLMRTVALEGRCVVLSANMCMTKANLPAWITGQSKGTGTDAAAGVNGHGHGHGRAASPARLRKKSTVVEDGNEIVLPDVETSAQPGQQQQQQQAPTVEAKRDASEFVSRGGSCIISPLGEVISGPLWDVEDGLLAVDVDFDDCLRGRLDLDVGGSYSRSDSFKLTVEGLDLSPPP